MDTKRTHVVISWLAVVGMACLIFWMSANTGQDINHGLGIISAIKGALISAATALFGHEVDVSPVGHFVEYLVFGALLFNALRFHMNRRHALIAALFIASAYGVSDELHQYFVPERSCDPADWAVDTVAAGIGALLGKRSTRTIITAASSAQPKETLMNRTHIEPFEYATRITQATPQGILLTTKAEGKVNTMVIGWGEIGTLWGRPVFTAYVRTSRDTRRMLDINPAFTVNTPLDGTLAKDVFALAGTKSGRDHDKIAELGLSCVDGAKIDVPALAEVPLTLECKVILRHELSKDEFPADVVERFYPADVTDIDKGGNCYTHVMYVGEIVDSYIVEA